jgi:hypothetical protein
MGNYLLAGLNLNINALHSVTGAPVVAGKISNLASPDLVN